MTNWEDDVVNSDMAKVHLVVLVHGIRTRAPWIAEVGSALEASGFAVAATGYGVFGLVRFLLPGPWFKFAPYQNVQRQIRNAIGYRNPHCVSAIAHSFGTYIIARLLVDATDIRWHRIIFCGSVVPDTFRFDLAANRITLPILNEIGSVDVWPAIAEQITWGYGAIGSYGLNAPEVRNRWHAGLRHSDFLTPRFCRENWVPFLRSQGHWASDVHTGDRAGTGVPLWLRVILWLPIRWFFAIGLIMILLSAAYLLARPPEYIIDKGLGASDAGYSSPTFTFFGRQIVDAIGDVNSTCRAGWIWNWIHNQRCINIEVRNSSIEDIIACHPHEIRSSDAYGALELLVARHPDCVEWILKGPRLAAVDLKADLCSFIDISQNHRLICDCNERETNIILKRWAPLGVSCNPKPSQVSP